ncbi:MAG: hypothetical protein ACFFFH_11585 [Candidatus Thorarchaeota archaeon]
MKICVTRGKTTKNTDCCEYSLFNKGNSVPTVTSEEDSMVINDWGYFTFPVQWKYSEGYEAPMAVSNYQKISVKRDNDFIDLPSNGSEVFRDLVVHYPFNTNGDVFIHPSYEDDESEKKWFGNLLLYKFRNSWLLEKRVKIFEYFRALQFIEDEKAFLILFTSRISAFNLDNFLERVLTSIESSFYYSKAHLSEDGRYLLAVIAPRKGSGRAKYHLYDFKTKESIILSRGINQISSNIEFIDSPILIPLLTDNGRVLMKISVI